MTTAEEKIALLEGAKGVIMDQGWCKGDYVAFDGRVCTMGAVYVAVGLEVYGGTAIFREKGEPGRMAIEAESRLGGLVRDDIGDPLFGGRVVTHWNDEVAQSAADVIDLFDRAIIDIKEESR